MQGSQLWVSLCFSNCRTDEAPIRQNDIEGCLEPEDCNAKGKLQLDQPCMWFLVFLGACGSFSQLLKANSRVSAQIRFRAASRDGSKGGLQEFRNWGSLATEFNDIRGLVDGNRVCVELGAARQKLGSRSDVLRAHHTRQAKGDRWKDRLCRTGPPRTLELPDLERRL